MKSIKRKPEILNPVVVITGADTATGLLTARSLSNLDCCVWGLALDVSAPCAQSKHWNKIIAVKLFDSHTLKNVGLNALAASGKKPLIIFSQDDWVIWFSRERALFSDIFDFILPDDRIVNQMMDKTSFHQWATEKKYTVPESMIVDDEESLKIALGSFKKPYIIKPLVRSAQWDSQYPNQKFFKINDTQDIPKLLDRNIFLFSERFVIQKWIPGEDSSLYFVLFSISRSGKVLARFTGQKLLQWPPQEGSTACCIVAENPGLLAQATEIVIDSGMTGLCSIEYKLDPETERFYITEPTIGRNDYQSYIANISGLNLTALLVCDHFKISDNQTDKRHYPGLWFDEIALLRIIRKHKFKSVKYLFPALGFLMKRKSQAMLFDRQDLQPFIHTVKRLIK